MAGFLYFIDGLTERPSDRQLADLSLGHLAGRKFNYCPCDRGPGGKGGLVLAVDAIELGEQAEGAFPVGFYSEKQFWQRSGKIFIGVQKDSPPRAIDLQKKKYQAGYKVELANGQMYLVAALRFVPRIWARDPVTGSMAKKARAEFTGLEESGQRIWNEFLAENKLELDDAEKDELMTDLEKYEAARDFLAVNYIVNDHEINYLQLFDDNSVKEILGAAVDMPAFIAMAKASEAENKKKLESSPNG